MRGWKEKFSVLLYVKIELKESEEKFQELFWNEKNTIKHLKIKIFNKLIIINHFSHLQKFNSRKEEIKQFQFYLKPTKIWDLAMLKSQHVCYVC